MTDSPAAPIGHLSEDGRWRWDGTQWQLVGAPPPVEARSPAMPAWVGRLFDFRVARAADWRVPVAVTIGAAAADAALLASRVGLAATLLAITICACLVLTRRVAQRQAIGVLVLAAVLSLFLTLRASPWLVVPDVLVTGGLIVLACALGDRGRLLDLSMPRALVLSTRAVLQMMPGPWFAAPPVALMAGRQFAIRRTQAWAVVRGVAIALPIMLLISWLLAQADVVFASFFQVSIDLGSIWTHLLFLAVGAWVVAGLLRAASSEPMDALAPVRWRLGAIESLIVLAGLDLVFGAFTLAQVIAATGAGAATLDAHGITYAEYAHSGFFQLLWVAAITLVLLLTLRTLVDRGRTFVVLAEIAIAFTLVIVFVAIQRLLLYVQAYDLSMLRLYCLVFAAWIGVVFVALGVSLTPLGRPRSWFPVVMAVSGAIGLLALNVINPEALLTRYNLAYRHQAQQPDVGYLASLSADAVPDLVAAVPSLDSKSQSQVRLDLCRADGSQDRMGWNGYNTSAAAALGARRTLCPRR